MALQKEDAPEHLAAVYVHAGAGYHNLGNENLHLRACASAAESGMLVLKGGGSAIEAVEAAVRCLEDNDITNAGFGSNLTMDGTVEGDATVVDHLGRSGAVGAITKVTNPISVARLVYEHSLKPMELKRVPPNLLTGSGATSFAQEQGIRLERSDGLVSVGSLGRWERWKLEIETAQGIRGKATADQKASVSIDEFEDLEEAMRQGPALSRNPTIAALANESQPPMPPGNAATPFNPQKLTPAQLLSRQRDIQSSFSRRIANRTPQTHRHEFDSNSESGGQRLDQRGFDSDETSISSGNTQHQRIPADFDRIVENRDHDDRVLNMSLDGLKISDDRHTAAVLGVQDTASTELDSDCVTDTVGAIAVDKAGRIAAASSSGGIGMKHSGRTGPAALVGIGTSVIPVDPDDEEQTTVACVTSGTGEHMASSMAAHTCAMRVYTNTKLQKGGQLVDTDEDDAMQSFVKKDFMGHPAVVASHSGGAIGAMLVKKSRDGMWLYWVHNTDSFALASMHADDEVPHAVMSRNKRAGLVVTGARAMRSTSSVATKSDTGNAGGPKNNAPNKRRRNLKRSSRSKPQEQEPKPAQALAVSSRVFSNPTHKFRTRSSKVPKEDGSAVGQLQIQDTEDESDSEKILATGG